MIDKRVEGHIPKPENRFTLPIRKDLIDLRVFRASVATCEKTGQGKIVYVKKDDGTKAQAYNAIFSLRSKDGNDTGNVCSIIQRVNLEWTRDQIVDHAIKCAVEDLIKQGFVESKE